MLREENMKHRAAGWHSSSPVHIRSMVSMPLRPSVRLQKARSGPGTWKGMPYDNPSALRASERASGVMGLPLASKESSWKDESREGQAVLTS